MMFVCYLDDSGTSGLPVTTLAGFVGVQSNWVELEPKLDEAMNAYGIPIFHAKEFHDTKPPFKGWSRIKKLSFAEEIFSLTSRKIYGLSITLRRSDYASYQKTSGRMQSMSVIGVCFAGIMARLFMHPSFKAGTDLFGVSFVVEAGNANQGEIARYFELMKDNPAYEGKLRSLTFVPKDHCRAIQLADYFAFYSRRYMQDHDRFSGRLSLPEPPLLNVIRKHGPIYQFGGRGHPEMTGMKIEKQGDVERVISALKRPKGPA